MKNKNYLINKLRIGELKYFKNFTLWNCKVNGQNHYRLDQKFIFLPISMFIKTV